MTVKSSHVSSAPWPKIRSEDRCLRRVCASGAKRERVDDAVSPWGTENEFSSTAQLLAPDCLSSAMPTLATLATVLMSKRYLTNDLPLGSRAKIAMRGAGVLHAIKTVGRGEAIFAAVIAERMLRALRPRSGSSSRLLRQLTARDARSSSDSATASNGAIRKPARLGA